MRGKKFSIKLGKYIPVLLILLSITLMIASTLAYFSDKVDSESSLTFGKVELSNETMVGVDGVLFDVLPGMKIIDGEVAFSKSIDSNDILVRAKLAFSLPKEFEKDNDMQAFIKQLRNSTDFNIVSENQNQAVWSVKDGNYFYLLDANDNTKLKVVNDIYTYKLATTIEIPRSLTQLEDNAQYMKSVNFHIAFEAIQSDNVDNSLDEAKILFDEVFPTPENEKAGIYVSVMNSTHSGIEKEIMLTSAGKIEEPQLDLTNQDGTTTHIVDGWYLDSGLTRVFDFDSIVTSSISLYPNVLEVSEGLVYEPIYETTMSSTPTSSEVGLSETQNILGYSVAQGICDDTIVVLPLEYMGKPIIEIAQNGFSLNENITNIYLPDTITAIGSGAFYLCENLELTELPSGITRIEEATFFRCAKLALTELSDNITFIAEDAFQSCESLALTKLPRDLTIISDSAFYDCPNLLLNELPSGVISIENGAFYNCNQMPLQSLPSGVTSVGDYAFYFCDNIELTSLPSGLEFIGQNAFNECDKLNIDEIPIGVISIGEKAFYACRNLHLLYLPTSINEIGINAFGECDNLDYLLCENKDIAMLAFGKGVNEGEIYYAQASGYESVTFTDEVVGDRTIGVGSDGNYVWVKDGEVYYKEYVAANTITYMNIDLTSVYIRVEVEDGKSTSAESGPVHNDPNAVFEGWYLDSALTNKFTFGNTLTSDITLYPKYDFIYQVVFMVDEENYNSQDIILNGYPTNPSNPTKSGYEFDGWTLNGNETVNPSTIQINENTTFTAKFTQLFTVTFTYEGNTRTTQTVRSGGKPTNVSVTSTTYKVFNGWKLNGSIVDETTQVITSDTTFVADITYKYDVKFMVDSTTHNSQIVTKDGYPTNPSNPTKSGYEFDGWLLNGNIVTPSSTKITANTTFTAKFTQLFTVTFTYEGSTYSTQTVRSGGKPTNVSVTSTNYKVFNGWKLNGTIVNVANQTITANTTFVADITYKYLVQFKVNNSVHSSSYVVSGSYATAPSNPSITDYTFNYWTTNGSTKVTLSSYAITADTTFIAKLTRTSYTGTFSSSNASMNNYGSYANYYFPALANVSDFNKSNYSGFNYSGTVTINGTTYNVNSSTGSFVTCGGYEFMLSSSYYDSLSVTFYKIPSSFSFNIKLTPKYGISGL